MAVELRVLGQVEVRVDGLVVEAGHARQRCVLSVLLMEANRVVTVEQLLDRVWADRLPYKARRVVSNYVSRLRRVLAGEAAIARRSGGYILQIDPEAVDLHRFRRLVKQAHGRDDAQALALLEEASGLWRGEAFDGLDTPWIAAVREGLARERFAADTHRLDAALRQGRHTSLLPELGDRAASHPLDERVAAQLMLALYHSGRQADALACYQDIRTRLAEELGTDPAHHLRDLHQRILTADPALTRPSAETDMVAVAEVPVPPAAPPRPVAGHSIEPVQSSPLPAIEPDGEQPRLLREQDSLRVDELTDRLATAMRVQWTAAAADRGLLDPAHLPIRWQRSTAPVAGPVSAATAPRSDAVSLDPLPGLARTAPAQLDNGTHRTLHAVYGGLTSGRLIITGGPGTGKSSAAILLLLDALRFRERTPADQRARVPVPVLFSLQGWEPQSTPLVDWLAVKLDELAVFTGRRRRSQAARLFADGHVSVFLDGLDEIPERHRATALQALANQARFRLVLLSRTRELAAAAEHHLLTGAAALELLPPTPADTVAYLRDGIPDPPPPPWLRLLNALSQTPSGDNDTSNLPILSRALDTPLTISLLRETYQSPPSNDAPHGGLDDLLDTTRFPTPEHITHHLLDYAITTACTLKPGQPAARYLPATVHRTLTVIARHLRDHDTRDIVWWQLPHWIPRQANALVTAIGHGTVLGIFSALCYQLAPLLTYAIPVNPVTGLVWGLPFGLAFGLAGLNNSPRVRAASPRTDRWTRAFARGPITGFIFGLVFGLAFFAAFGLIHSLPVLSNPLFWSDLIFAIMYVAAQGVIPGFALGLMTGLAAGLTSGIAAKAVQPHQQNREHRIYWLMTGLVFPLAVVSITWLLTRIDPITVGLGELRADPYFARGLLTGGAAGLVVGLTFRLTNAESPGRIGRFRWSAGRWVMDLMIAMLYGLLLGLAVGLGFEVVFAGDDWLALAAVIGTALGLAVGLALGLAGGFNTGDRTIAVDARQQRRGDLAYRVATGLMTGLFAGPVLGLVLWLTSKDIYRDTSGDVGLMFWITYGLLFALAFGTAGGLTSSAAWGVIIAQVYFRMRHHTPLRLWRLLDHAHDRHLLRTIGPVYQFRHATLQDRLAPPHPTATHPGH